MMKGRHSDSVSERIGYLQPLILLVVVAILSVSFGVRSSDFKDEDLKAVYLFRFAFLVNWQSVQSQDGRYDFCVYGDTRVGRRLSNIIDQKSDQARFRDIEFEDPVKGSCNIIYTQNSSATHIVTLHTQFPNALLVGEGTHFVNAGGMIGFIKANNRIKPLISRNNLQGLSFTLRSQLMSISVIHEEEAI